jgi:photosystem II stability/assembly factor-like uncharacterized protein
MACGGATNGRGGPAFQWDTTPLNTTSYLLGVWGSSDTDVYVVGVGGYLFHSTDSGGTWAETDLLGAGETPGFGPTLSAVAGSSASDVYVAGSDGSATPEAVVYHSADEGQTWQLQTVVADVPQLLSLWVDGPNDVYAGGFGGTVLHSTDGGQTWTQPSTGTDLEIWSVWGSGPADVYLVGFSSGNTELGEPAAGNIVLHSADHGVTWNLVRTPTGSWGVVWGRSESEVYLGGASGAVVVSRDQGRSWKSVSSGIEDAVSTIQVLPDSTLFISDLTVWIGPHGTIYELGSEAAVTIGHEL